jgi:two-component system, sensor histidine kinase and response regulator
LGQGSTFEFELPIQVATASQVRQATMPIPRVLGLAPGQPQYPILAVDDCLENRKLLVKLLTPMGFEVKEAGNGALYGKAGRHS